MSITWEVENDTVFAVAYGEIINGYYHEELIIAEIDKALGAFMVRFESAWSYPIHCASLEEAKNLIIRDHSKYKPTSVGRNYFLR